MFICLELWQKHKPLLTKTYLYSWKFSCKYCNNKYVAIYSRTFLKFIYSEKATKFCGILTLLLTAVHTVKSKAKISQNFVAFSEYMDFKNILENLSFVVCWGVDEYWIIHWKWFVKICVFFDLPLILICLSVSPFFLKT